MRPKEKLESDQLVSIAEDIVSATLDELPDNIAAEVAQVSVFVEIEPDEGDRACGVGADWLGIFEGADHSHPDLLAPPRIRIWVRNLWTYAGGREAKFREEVRVTLLHEIGHYLGLDEAGVARLGLE